MTAMGRTADLFSRVGAQSERFGGVDESPHAAGSVLVALNTDQKSIWHNYKGRSRFNMLYGEGHAQFYQFPDKLKDWTFDPKPNRDWLWW